MALLKMSDIRNMSDEEKEKKLAELRTDLMHERGVAAMGGAPPNPGKMRALKKNISKVLTVMREAK